MKSLRFFFAALIPVLLFSVALQAQSSPDKWCGTNILRSDWMTKYQAGEFAAVGKSDEILYVPARFIILGENDGSGYIDPIRLLRSFELLNSDYEDMNIQFYIKEVDYLNRSSYYDHANFSTGNQMMSLNNNRNVINNYIVGNPAGNCGYYNPGSDALALGINCLGAVDRTWSHEMGHLLNLDHTFYGWESVEEIANIELTERAPETLLYRGVNVPVERMDSSNCELAGDGFCDTAPDYLMERWACNDVQEYRDSLTDPDSIRFAVPAINIMSYALDGCIEGFSEDQKTAMQTNLAARQIADNSGVDRVAADGDAMNLLLPVNNATLEVSDQVELVWNSVPNADYYIVQLNTSTNFNGTVLQSFIVTDTTTTIEDDLNPNTRYYWRVRPFNRYVFDSDFGDQKFRFKNGEFPTATIDATLNSAISVAPNPVSGGQELRIDGRDLGQSGNMTYELIDATGRVLLSRENLNVTAAGFNERIQTAGMPAGVYFLRIRLNEKLVTRRVVVTP